MGKSRSEKRLRRRLSVKLFPINVYTFSISTNLFWLLVVVVEKAQDRRTHSVDSFAKITTFTDTSINNFVDFLPSSF